MFDAWLLQFSLLPRVTPGRVISGSDFLKILSTEKISGMVKRSPRIMTAFSGFIFIKLSLNQSIIREYCDSISLNNSGPKTDPWGIPMIISTHSLKELLISVIFSFSLSNYANSLMFLIPNPYGCSLAMRRSCGIQSYAFERSVRTPTITPRLSRQRLHHSVSRTNAFWC